MQIARNSFLGRKSLSPPQLGAGEKKSPDLEHLEMSAGAEKESNDTSWGKVALGLVMATSALAGCELGEPVAPAEDPGSYVLDSPEVVVMSDSLARIDISRETEDDCTGFGEDEVCYESDVAYHRMGIHVGHGVVQDFNGNLFAAPQLVADGAPAAAVSNPESAVLKINGKERGRISKVDEKTVELSGRLGRGLLGNDNGTITSTRESLFGGATTRTLASSDGQVTTIFEGTRADTLVQSQGEHLLVQSPHGRAKAEIRHHGAEGYYEVSFPRRSSSYNYTVDYNEEQMTVERNGRVRLSVQREQSDDSGAEFNTKVNDRGRGVNIELKDQGWKEFKPGIVWGKRVSEVEHSGGTLLP